MQMNCELRKNEIVPKNSKKNKDGVLTQVDIEKQIQEYEENNEKLVQQIKELTKTWKEMSLGSASTANEGSSYIGGNTSNKFTKKGRRTKSSFK